LGSTRNDEGPLLRPGTGDATPIRLEKTLAIGVDSHCAAEEASLQKPQQDLYCAKNHSLFLEMRVLFETVKVVLTGRRAH
jgi:hypothetical protein